MRTKTGVNEMKLTVLRKTEVEVTHLEVDAGVRYWEDATVNGVDEDDDNPTIFGRVNDRWRVMLNLEEGRIENWPSDMEAKVHYKVADDGEYWLIGADGLRVDHKSGYVPSAFLCHGDEGYGDYIILNIGKDGRIADYTKPNLDRDWKSAED